MKKLLFLLFPIVIFAQSSVISTIRPPQVEILNLDPYECDSLCMQNFLDNEQIFSFLAHANNQQDEQLQQRARSINLSLFNPTTKRVTLSSSGTIHIAILLPYRRIGKYASSTTNASFAYLISKNHPFELKSYRVESESMEDLENALYKIQEDGFEYVIAPLTQVGASNVVEINPPLTIYFPTINKKDVNSHSDSLFFGAIDYQEQTNLLIDEAVSPLVIFSDKSALGKKLALYEEDRFKYGSQSSQYDDFDRVAKSSHRVVQYSIPRKVTNLERYLKRNRRINRASFFLNTRVVKSGMIMSQLTLYDTNAVNILSTQINYDPLILSMTQYEDRRSMIIANSIIETDNNLVETNALLGNDIVYDWINYTTTVGVDYFFSLMTGESRTFSMPMQNNQIRYSTELLKPSGSRFVKFFSIK